MRGCVDEEDGGWLRGMGGSRRGGGVPESARRERKAASRRPLLKASLPRGATTPGRLAASFSCVFPSFSSSTTTEARASLLGALRDPRKVLDQLSDFPTALGNRRAGRLCEEGGGTGFRAPLPSSSTAAFTRCTQRATPGPISHRPHHALSDGGWCATIYDGFWRSGSARFRSRITCALTRRHGNDVFALRKSETAQLRQLDYTTGLVKAKGCRDVERTKGCQVAECNFLPCFLP